MRTMLFALCLATVSCKTAMPTADNPTDSSKNVLAHIMNASADMQHFLQNKDSFNIQVIYTQIDRDGKNKPRFTDYTFNVNPDNYFYPASTVKMPIAFLALEKLNQLKEKSVDRNAVMVTDSSFNGQQVAYTHPSSADSRASIAHYVKQIFLVSDNDASNRLYEFLGQQYLHEQLKRKGFDNSVIRHRLAISLSPEQNKHTNPVSFHDTTGNVLYEQPAQYSNVDFPVSTVKLGKGYHAGDKLVNEPFDFSLKNRVSLQDLHRMLKAMIFPNAVAEEQRFNVSEDDRQFLLRWMSSYPRESKHPFYDTTEYPDGFTKFLGRNIIHNPNIRIYSKAGWAYGFLTDVAYITDVENNVEFMISATILCNSDGIFNDDNYDFEKTGYPFMRLLGELVYQHELKRPKKHKPDMSAFHFDYTTD